MKSEFFILLFQITTMSGLVKVIFNKGKKNEQTKELAPHIANDKQYQKAHNFVLADESPATSGEKPLTVEKKIVHQPEEGKAVVAETETPVAQIETSDIVAESNEEKVVRLHKEGKTEAEIKDETKLHHNTIRKIIKSIN